MGKLIEEIVKIYRIYNIISYRKGAGKSGV